MMIYALIFLGIISIVSAVLTIYDKIAAKASNPPRQVQSKQIVQPRQAGAYRQSGSHRQQAQPEQPQQKKKKRIPEGTLMTLGALGGALAMYITMQLIRHKTKHAKFMIGLPIIILAQIGIILALHLWVFDK